MRFGAFIAPLHSTRENPTLAIERDFKLVELMDELTYDEAWIGEHHSSGFEITADPLLFIAAAAERTRNIRLGSGVSSLSYHHPFILADRFVQLDHQTRGRVMMGAGPGQLPSDAQMMGLDPVDQRRMMVESLESMLSLFAGETVTRKADWFELRNARLQILPYQRPRMEVAVAAVITPSGPSLAGRLGLSMLSLAASTPTGFQVLPQHWQIFEDEARCASKPASRESWRVVAPMHIAPTREQAWAEAKENVLDLVMYYRKITGGAFTSAQAIDSAEDAMKAWTTEGLYTTGVLMAGTPEDAINYIERLKAQSGGFGTFLILAHNAASVEATRRSYDLFARFVMPHFQRLNILREESLNSIERDAADLMARVAAAQKHSTAVYQSVVETRLEKKT
jgi:limonene 1,2-monooxygenase